jgi:hypothetical protein
MDEPRHPELRASDRDRERTAEHLRRAAGDGQLTMDELDERLHAAHTSRTRGDLERITADLQPVDDTGVASASAPAPAPASGGFAVRRGEGGARWLLAILGGCERKGRWRLATQATCVNIMGGSELDLNQVELAGDHVELTVVSIMGGAEIRVPNGLRVEVSELALMGGNSIDISEDRPSVASGPVLHLRLFSLMGGTDVKRGPKLSRAERRALKEQRRGHLGSPHPPPPLPPRGPRP